MIFNSFQISKLAKDVTNSSKNIKIRSTHRAGSGEYLS
jgi:hypothetical protein